MWNIFDQVAGGPPVYFPFSKNSCRLTFRLPLKSSKILRLDNVDHQLVLCQSLWFIICWVIVVKCIYKRHPILPSKSYLWGIILKYLIMAHYLIWNLDGKYMPFLNFQWLRLHWVGWRSRNWPEEGRCCLSWREMASDCSLLILQISFWQLSLSVHQLQNSPFWAHHSVHPSSSSQLKKKGGGNPMVKVQW